MTDAVAKSRRLIGLAPASEPAAPPPPAADCAPTADQPALPPGKANGRDAGELYRRVMIEVEYRRQQLGLSHDLASDLIGLPDRYLPKLLHSDERSGKRAKWETLDLIAQTFWPDGYDLQIRAHRGPKLTAFLLKHRIRNAASISDRRLLRQIMQERGRLGGLATKAKLTRAQRIRLAKRASKFRNQRLDAERRSALARHAVSVRNGRMTAEQRKESARRAARARWSKAEERR